MGEVTSAPPLQATLVPPAAFMPQQATSAVLELLPASTLCGHTHFIEVVSLACKTRAPPPFRPLACRTKA